MVNIIRKKSCIRKGEELLSIGRRKKIRMNSTYETILRSLDDVNKDCLCKLEIDKKGLTTRTLRKTNTKGIINIQSKGKNRK